MQVDRFGKQRLTNLHSALSLYSDMALSVPPEGAKSGDGLLLLRDCVSSQRGCLVIANTLSESSQRRNNSRALPATTVLTIYTYITTTI